MMPDDWHSFGWINISPGESEDYHSISASPEIYYYAYSEDREFCGSTNTYCFAINKESNFEYHLPENPKSQEIGKFTDIVYFDRTKWPYRIIFE
jgi:hypothetical protein